MRTTKKGMTQGSPLAPGVCSNVLIFLEYRSKIEFLESFKWTTRLLMRWVDDKWGLLTLWYLASSDQEVEFTQQLESMKTAILDVYRAEFGTKVEDSTIFVGLEMSVSHGHVSFEQHFDDKVRFQNFYGCRPRRDKISNVVSQIAAAVDRCFGRCLPSSLQRLFSCFVKAGYPHHILLEAVHSFCRCHPYLRSECLAGLA